jgi:type VI protein secretion system component Hcp
MQPHYRTNRIEIFYLIILTNVPLARLNNALPDDGDYTETCWSCFNVNINVNFKIVFKTIQLCISW